MFLTTWEWCNISLSLQDKQWIPLLISKFWEFKRWHLAEYWRNDSILHHKNTDCHTFLTLQQFLMKNQSPAIPQPPHYRDNALCKFSVLFKVQDWAQRSLYCFHRRNSTYCNNRAQGRTRRGLAEMFPAMSGPLKQVCRMAVFWGWHGCILYI